MNAPPTPMADIKASVAEHFGLSLAVLCARDNSPLASDARHVAMYLGKAMLGKNNCEIGKRFDRDHTTVIHALRRVASRPDLIAAADAVRARMAG